MTSKRDNYHAVTNKKNNSKTRSKRTTLLLVVFAFSISASVLSVSLSDSNNVNGDADFSVNYGDYTLNYGIIGNTDDVSIVGYDGNSSDLTIPGTVVYPDDPDGATYNVVSIGDNAFKGCTTLETVVADSVESVGYSAFESCSNLKEVNMDSVKSVDARAFAACSDLKTISMNAVLSIGNYAFSSCTTLENISINTVQSTENAIFSYCTSLKTVMMESVKTMGDEIFYGCTDLTTVSMNSIESMGNLVFCNCTSLTSILVSSANEHFSSVEGILFDKKKTTLVCYPASKAEESYVVPSTVKTISMDAFRNCVNLKTVSMSSVQTIGDRAFFESKSLENVIMDSVESIDDCAFQNCMNLKAISMNSVESIGDYAFLECRALMTISMNSVESIGDYAFLECRALKAISMNSVESIGDYAFRYCTGLENVSMNSVKTIGNSAFYECTGLKIVSMNSVENIEEWAFFGCTALTSFFVDPGNENYSSDEGILFDRNKTTLIHYPAGKTDKSYTVPTTVITISRNAFFGCNNLITVNMDHLQFIDIEVFYGCTGLETVSMNSVENVGEQTFEGCTNLKVVSMNSVKDIDNSAFQNCPSLKIVILPEETSSDTQIEKSVIRIHPSPNIKISISEIDSSNVDMIEMTISAKDGYALVGTPSAEDAAGPITISGSGNVWSLSVPLYDENNIRHIWIEQSVFECYLCTVTINGNDGTVKYSLNGTDWNDIPSNGVIDVPMNSPTLMIRTSADGGYEFKWADEYGVIDNNVLSITLNSNISIEGTFSAVNGDSVPPGGTDDPLDVAVIATIITAVIISAVVAVYMLFVRKP